MADATVDTSSYKLPVQPSALDTVGKLQGLQQQQLQISKQQIDLAKTRLDNMTQLINAVPPEAGIDEYFKTAQEALNRNLVDQNGYNEFIKSLPNDPSQLPQFKTMILGRAMQAENLLNWHYGQQTTADNGQTYTPGVQSNRPGFAGAPQGGFLPTSPPVQKQNPVGLEVKDTNEFLPDGKTPNPNYGQTRIQGPQTPQLAPGTVSQPTPFNRLPVAPPTAAAPTFNKNFPAGNPMAGVNSQQPSSLPVESPSASPNQVVQNNFPNVPRGPATGMPPLFEEGKKTYSEDQALATQKLTAIKPALAALDMMKDLRSGPGTETYNKAVAFMKANNIISTEANDPTAIYQEVNKYLNQYVQGSGTRSDADLAQRELSNPNVTQQISPALIKLTRNTIALDRIQAARSGAFADDNGNQRTDFSKYGQHRSTFPANQDERAYIVDRLDPQEKQQLFKNMLAKKDTPEGKKFFKSLQTAKNSGIFGQ